MDDSFLATMQIPILLGRGFEQRDMSSPRVAVVTEQFAKKFFAGENPLGAGSDSVARTRPADIEIVGVAKTTLYNSVKETETPPVAYVPYTQDLPGLGRVHFELRTAGDPLALVNAVRARSVHQASASVPVSEVRRRPRGSIRPSARSARSPISAHVLRCSRWRSRASGYTARWHTRWRGAPTRSASAWRSGPSGGGSSGWCCAKCLCWGPRGCYRTWLLLGRPPDSWNRSCLALSTMIPWSIAGFGARAACRCIPGRLRSRMEGITNRPDGGPAARVV